MVVEKYTTLQISIQGSTFDRKCTFYICGNRNPVNKPPRRSTLVFECRDFFSCFWKVLLLDKIEVPMSWLHSPWGGLEHLVKIRSYQVKLSRKRTFHHFIRVFGNSNLFWLIQRQKKSSWRATYILEVNRLWQILCAICGTCVFLRLSVTFLSFWRRPWHSINSQPQLGNHGRPPLPNSYPEELLHMPHSY